MKERLEDLRAASLTHLRSAGSWLAAHRSSVELAVLTVLAVVAAYAVGSSSLEAAARYQQETRELTAVGAGAHRWATRLQPVAPAETAAWLESEQAVRTVGAEGTDPTTIARIVAARAEEAGISNLGMRLARPGELATPPRVEVGSWAISTGGSGVSVEFLGDWPSIMGFLASLPPQVGVGSVQVEPGPEFLLRARVILLAREVSSD